MTRLEDIVKGMKIQGIVHDIAVEIIEVKPGKDNITIVYRDTQGRVDTRMIFRNQESTLSIIEEKPSPPAFDVDGSLFRVVSEAYRLRLAHLFDPLLAVHISLVEPLPHQITAVYEDMLPRQPLKFLLADDPGAGKTIMAGLLIKELIVRGDVERCLICCPGSLAEQWQDEMRSKFNLGFNIVTRDLIETDLGGNPFNSFNFVIGRLDQMSRSEDVLEKVKRANDWDLIVCDEAHKMSCPWYGNEPKPTQRYILGKELSKKTRHLLLMTATPHNGKDEDFQSFLQIIDSDRFEGRHRAGEKIDAKDLMRRMVKEGLVKFDETPLFPERRAYTPLYDLSEEEQRLYQCVTEYVRSGMNLVKRLMQKGQGTRGSVVGFALTCIQRRLASSPEAIYQTLKRRKENLTNELNNIKNAKKSIDDLGKESAGVSVDDEEDYSEDEFYNIESEAVTHYTAAETIPELEKEIEQLTILEKMADVVRQSSNHGKWNQLANILKNQKELFDNLGHRRKMIIFTEHRDTLNYLLTRIRGLLGNKGAVVEIHGGLNRDERRTNQEEFIQNKDVIILVATDAAGEGVNLQRANLMINYDIPWNPNRLEQRFGRIHRIGQTEVCHMWNMVAKGTREGEVLKHLFDKLKVEEQALQGRVFDILGRAIDAVELKDLLMEAIMYGDSPEVKARLFQKVEGKLDHKRLQELLEERALSHDTMDSRKVRKIKEEVERAEARKLQPHYIQTFFVKAFKDMGGSIYEREPKRFEITNVPAPIRKKGDALACGYKLPTKYERITFDKDMINSQGKPTAEFVCPGHALLDAVIEILLEQNKDVLLRGAVLVDEQDSGTEPRMLWFVQSEMLDGRTDSKGNNRVVSQHLHFVECDGKGECRDMGYAPYLDYKPLGEGETQIVSGLQERITGIGTGNAAEFASSHILPVYFKSERERREKIVDKTLIAVNERLKREIAYWDSRANEFKAQELAGKKTKLSSGNARRRADELEARLKVRLTELEKERHVDMRPPVVIGNALVVPQGLLNKLLEKEPEPGLFAENRSEVDKKAVAAVLETERKLGREPKEMPHNHPGYDIESKDPKTGRLLFLEVKGRIEGAPTVTVTRTEIMTGLNKPETYILAIVSISESGESKPVYVRNPYEREPEFSVVSENFDIKKLLNKGGQPS